MKTVSADLYTSARYGGEEFVMLLPHTSLDTAREVAESIRQHVANISIKNNVTSKLISNVTISLGLTAYQPGETAESFLNRADQALYTAKAKGRNQVTLIADEALAAA
jgi:diguanylate cyclase